jgi:hypothetical protein
MCSFFDCTEKIDFLSLNTSYLICKKRMSTIVPSICGGTVEVKNVRQASPKTGKSAVQINPAQTDRRIRRIRVRNADEGDDVITPDWKLWMVGKLLSAAIAIVGVQVFARNDEGVYLSTDEYRFLQSDILTENGEAYYMGQGYHPHLIFQVKIGDKWRDAIIDFEEVGN